MAVTTQINDFPTWYGAKSIGTLFGYPVPDNVRAVDHTFNVLLDTVTIAWSTNIDLLHSRRWHHMEIEMPMTHEKVTALLIAMKLSC